MPPEGHPFTERPRSDPRRPADFYLVGGGIASLAAAAFLIRDGDIEGHRITILEASGVLGGSLDGAGSAADGYRLRGGRMLESKYVCTFGLFDSVPTLDGRQTVTAETIGFSETIKTSSKSRLVRDGKREPSPAFGLSERDILAIERLAMEPEAFLARMTIAEQVDPAFFKTDFWFMWGTTFAFQPWHSAVEFKRYLLRFAHMVSGFEQLRGIMRTRLNQYDSMVRPLHRWLDDHGVNFELSTRVTDLHFVDHDGETRASRIVCDRDGIEAQIVVGPDDRVFVTLGSMTEASRFGTMDAPAALCGKTDGDAWALWERIAVGRPRFGRPGNFDGDVAKSKWVSFTTTMRDPALLRIVRDLTGNAPGEGGLVTFPNSGWLMSIVVPHQPHFEGQPDDVSVFWGYGLSVDAPGDFVGKPMAACSGREIMLELLGHLGALADAQVIVETCVCIPCMMPFITSQFLPRSPGDRPAVIPAGTRDLAFIGEFCEMPDDVVFTVEYSIRSAQVAAYALLDLSREPPPVYKGAFDPRVLYQAFRALHDVRS